MKKLIPLLAVFALAGPVHSAETNKDRLRRLVELPTISVRAEVGFSMNGGFYFNGMKPDPIAEIARIRKELKGDDSDAERYLNLGAWYAKADRKKESEDAYAKAIASFRRQVKERPDDMRRLAQLGDALVEGGSIQDAEPLLRRAVQQAANEWCAWLALGKCVEDRSIQAILGDKKISAHFSHDATLSSRIFTEKPSAEQIAQWHRLHQEARRCFDRAIELAPKEANPYRWRIAGRLYQATVETGLRAAEGKSVKGAMAAMLTSECAADTRRLAELCPDDPKAIGMAVCVEPMVCILHDQIEKTTALSAMFPLPPGVESSEEPSLIDLLPKRSRDFVRSSLRRLETLAESADESKAADDASEILANALMVIHMQGDDANRPKFLRESAERAIPKIVKHLSRTVQLDPTRERAWDLLTALQADKGSVAEAIAMAERRIKIKDDALNRFILATGYAQQQQYDKAAEQLRDGLKSDENDLNCRLGLIAVLLQRGDAEALKEAGEQIDAAAFHRQQKSKSRVVHFLLLRGLHAALSDRPEQAKDLFQQVLKRDDTNKKARTALFALGERMGPAQESEAIAIIKRRGGAIHRQGNRSDSPVVEAIFSGDKFTDADLLVLTAFPQLRSLSLNCDAITEEALDFLEPLPQLRTLEIASEKVTDAGLVCLKRFPNLRRLLLLNKVSDEGMVHLQGLTQLRSLDVHSSKITDKGLIHLKTLTNLRSLELDGGTITDAGMALLDALPHLEHLKLPDSISYGSDDEMKPDITDAGLAHLGKLRNLRDLWMTGSLTDEGLAHVASLPRVRKLHITFSKITDEGMKHFEHCSELRELCLSSTKIGDAGLAHLKGLGRLRELHLDNTKITDAGLAHLKGLTGLEILNLNNTAIADAGLVHLRGLAHLRQLSLGQPLAQWGSEMESLLLFPGQEPKPSKKQATPAITDAGLEHLQTLTALETLDLTSRPVTGRGLASLQRLPRLSVLAFDSSKLTDADLCPLEKFPRLESLFLDGGNITDAGITHLHKLTRLKSVGLRNTKVTAKGVAELRKALPKLNISR